MNKGKTISFADDFELKKAMCKLMMRACACGFIFFLLNGLCLLAIDKYIGGPDWLHNLIFVIMALFEILLLVPTCLNKRMINWMEEFQIKPEPPKIIYDRNEDDTPVAKEYFNTEDCKLNIVIYDNRATVWMLQNGTGQNVFSGDINLCLREVSKYWNKCQITMLIGCMPTDKEDKEILDLPDWKVELDHRKTEGSVTE